MFKKQVELIKPIIYEDEAKAPFFGQDNRAYRSLTNLFEAFWIYAKKELYLVGGVVRDLLLGKKPKDYDLCTDATPDEVKQICEALHLKTFDSGIKHGTLTIIDDFYGQSYEITTYRRDGKYTDSRHPDEVIFTPSLEEDLKRRDFTINSFAYDMLRQELLALDESYFKDLEYGMIRTVGNAEERFNEDALRILRALRFSAQLNFAISAETFEAIKKLASNLSKISKERIRDELTKILLSDNPQVLELFVIAGLEQYCFSNDKDIPLTPITDALNCPHENPWHYTDVFHHTMDVIKAVPKTFELRWAALFHDLGKPAVKCLKEGTVDHYNYHGHPEVSVQITEIIADILKFSNNQKELIIKYVKYHDTELVECRDSRFKAILVDIGKENFLDFVKLRRADALAHQISKDTKYAVTYIDKILTKFDKVITEDQALKITDLAINGNDIIADGFLRGKEIGDCLRWMLNIVLDHPEYNTREKLLEYLEIFKEMSFQSS